MGMLKQVYQKCIGSKNLRNSFWIIAEQGFQMLLSLVIGVISARYLGPGNYGTLTYTASFVTFCTAIATLNMDGIVLKKMVYDPEHEGHYLGTCMVFRLVASLLSSFAATLVVFLLNPNDPLKYILTILQSFDLIFTAFHLFDMWFQRHLQSKYVSISKTIASLLVAAYRIFLLVTAKDIIWFAIVSSLSKLLIAILLYIFYRKQKGPRLRVEKQYGVSVLRESYHFIISGLMVSIYSQMDKIMIGSMMQDADVGLYNAASSICTIWLFVPLAIINSFRPMLFESKKSGDERLYHDRVKQLYSAIVWLCLVASLGVTLVAPLFVHLMYGEAYAGAIPALQILIWAQVFAMMGTIRSIWVMCEDKNKYVKYFLGLGAAVNLVLNYLLIPVMGISGAALATLVTHIIADFLSPLLFKSTRRITLLATQGAVFEWAFHRKSRK